MFKTDLAYDNWKEKYRYLEESPLETWIRVAVALASVEKKEEQERWEKQFMETIVRFDKEGRPIGLKCTPGGRITANIGTGFKNATLINCYGTGPVKGATISYTRESEDKSVSYPVNIQTKDDPDDMFNIFLSIVEQAKTLASEGGYGTNFDFIRPRGSLIKGTGIEHPGVVSYLKIWDAVADCIVRGNTDGYLDKIKNYLGEKTFKEGTKIIKTATRKGAMMGALSSSHPDIEEFIRAKQTPGALTKFNLSVVIDDKFMKAVESDDFYDLSFKDKVYKRIKARDLYDLIMESTYNRAEPGILFVDNIHKCNPIAYLGKANTSNPCVSKGTLVATINGLKPVEEIIFGELIQTTLGFEPVKNIEIHEKTEVYRVTFSDLSFLDVSEGHIFHTQPSNKSSRKKWDNTNRLNDLCVGDFIRKDKYKFRTQNNSEFTRDLGLLAGLFLGDGHIDANGNTCISVDQRADSSYIYKLCDRLGVSHWIDDSATDGFSRKIIIGGKEDKRASRVLKDKLGLDVQLEAPQKKFPYWWINTNEHFLCGLLDGLLCSDGNINDTGNYPQIRFKSVSTQLHSMIRHLMFYFGADYKVYECEKVGEHHKIFNRVIKRNYTIYEGIIDNDSILSVYERLGQLSHPEKNKILKDIIKKTSLTGVKWKTRIKNIEKIGLGTVYDLYTEEADDWNTCGIVSKGCGEVPVLSCLTTVCLLGSLNLPQYVYIENNKPKFDWPQYENDIKIFTRMLDNVNDITFNALPSYDWATKNLRQIGMGIGGLGSAMMMLGIPYNSKEAVEFTKKLCQTKENLTWQASALLAKEKGTFTAYNKEKFESTEYFKSDSISEETKDLIRANGVRNAKTTTYPPLGNTSVITDNTSNGIEPVFLLEYDRKKVCNKWPDGLDQENIKDTLKYHKKKDYEYWQGEYGGKIYYYEPHNRGLCEVLKVRDYGYQWLLDNFPNKDHSKYLITTKDLKIEDHLNIQETAQHYCNQAVSKTCNIPANYPFEDFKNLYLEAWKKGLCGFTTYRANSMESVFSDIQTAQESKGIIKRDIKLPEEFINGPTKIIKREGIKFYLHFSYLPDDAEKKFPIVLWIYTNDRDKDSSEVCNKASRKLAKLALDLGVGEEFVKNTLKKAREDYPHNRLGRVISICLRHNVPVVDILVNLMNIEGDNVSTLLTAVRKFLGESLEDGTPLKGIKCTKCKGDRVILQSGCKFCLDCHFTGCG